MKTFGILALGGAMGVQFEDLTYNNLREAYMEVSDKNDCWTNFDPLWIRFNPTIQAVPKVYGNKNLDTAIIGNDYLPYFKWCDANGDGTVALFESARCGSKSGFWYPSQVGWFDWATYATSISLDFAQIMMKYMENLDRDGSMTLDQSEFAWHYAAMTHTSMEAAFALLDEDKDEKLTGNLIYYKSGYLTSAFRNRVQYVQSFHKTWCRSVSSKNRKSRWTVCSVWNASLCEQGTSYSLHFNVDGSVFGWIWR